jgi:hypothetical protein
VLASSQQKPLDLDRRPPDPSTAPRERAPGSVQKQQTLAGTRELSQLAGGDVRACGQTRTRTARL